MEPVRRRTGARPRRANRSAQQRLHGPTDTNCMPPEHEFAEPIDTVNDPNNDRGHRDFLNDVGLLMAIDNSNTAA